jgi:catechol 2,3-dioxygenase-like lactoylglutathione lyase family enzyme
MLAGAAPMAFIATKSAEKALEFYRDRLGLTLVEDSPFALVFRSGTVELRVQKVEAVTVAPYTVLGWIVPDIVSAVQGLSRVGVVFERYPGIDQDEFGIWKTPGSARVAWFKDPEGHTLSLTQT